MPLLILCVCNIAQYTRSSHHTRTSHARGAAWEGQYNLEALERMDVESHSNVCVLSQVGVMVPQENWFNMCYFAVVSTVHEKRN